MTQPTKGSRGAASARPTEGLASEAARSPQAAAATPSPTDADAPDLKHCADCRSDQVVYVTEDPAAEPRAYCARHLPANVTDKMVKEQQGG